MKKSMLFIYAVLIWGTPWWWSR